MKKIIFLHLLFIITFLLFNFQSHSACPVPVPAPATPVLPPLTMFTKHTLGTWSMSTGVSIVVQPDGSVWCAGSDQDAELGDGTVGSPFNSNNQWLKVMNPDISNIQQLDNGFNTNLVLRTDGTVWGWGDNWVGKIGDGTYALGGGISPQPVPQQVIKSAATGGGFLTNVVKVMSGDNCTVALTSDHKVYAWGKNSGGQFGPSFALYAYLPAAELLTDDGVNPIDWAMDVECGDDFIVILRWDGTVWAMGDGSFGQLGNNNGGVGIGSIIPVGAYAPGVCTALRGIKSISAGRRFVLAVDSSGNAYGWGLNNYGQTGNGNAGPDVYRPEKIVGVNCSGFLTNIVQVEAAGDAGYALNASGDLYSWGSDQNEELADGPGGTNRQCPLMVYSNVGEVQAGLYSVLVRKTDGSVCAAGNNWFGNFGLGGAFGCCNYIDVFTCINITGDPLPVELISFTGKANGDLISLQWTTASEANNDYFTIEKSNDGILFSELKKIKGANNSTSVINYAAEDYFPSNGINYYKLSQTDYNGHQTDFNILPVKFVSSPGNMVLFPNPVSAHSYLSFSLDQSEYLQIHLFEPSGRMLKKIFSGTLNSGRHEVKLDTGNLADGIYFCKIKSGENLQTIKLLKLLNEHKH